MKYPADNPITRLEKLQRKLDEAKTQQERDKLQRKLDLLRNGA
jgi:hypothetical protein